jgi:DNA-binding response OmpR family regulator
MNRILIVDDEIPIQILYADALTEEGYEVMTTGAGSGILELIGETQPDLVVLDIRLGDSNGLDLLQDIRATYYELPVILCSAYSAFRYDLRSVAADYFIVKSSDLNELKVKIEMSLENRRPFLTKAMMKVMKETANQWHPAL